MIGTICCISGVSARCFIRSVTALTCTVLYSQGLHVSTTIRPYDQRSTSIALHTWARTCFEQGSLPSLLAIPGKAARLMLPGDKCSYPNLWQQGKPDLLSFFFPIDVSSQGSSEDCLRISHHTYPTHIQHITHIPHISIANVSTTHIPHISSTLHISHTYPFQTYPTHTYPTSTYPCNAYPFKRL